MILKKYIGNHLKENQKHVLKKIKSVGRNTFREMFCYLFSSYAVVIFVTF